MKPPPYEVLGEHLCFLFKALEHFRHISVFLFLAGQLRLEPFYFMNEPLSLWETSGLRSADLATVEVLELFSDFRHIPLRLGQLLFLALGCFLPHIFLDVFLQFLLLISTQFVLQIVIHRYGWLVAF